MKNRLLMFLFLGVLIIGVGSSAPSILDVSGNLEHGQSITISGNDF